MKRPTESELVDLHHLVTGAKRNRYRAHALTLYYFLPVNVLVDGRRMRVRSTLEAILEDVRQIAGRDDEGTLRPNAPRGPLFLTALGYLAAVDQLSSALDVPPPPANWNVTKGASPFEHLLMYDGVVAEDEAAALYGLRCALVHNYGLVNDAAKVRSKDRKKLLMHSFRLSADGSGLIRLDSDRGKLAKRLDEGKAVDLTKFSRTEIDIVTLGDDVERLIRDLRSNHGQRTGLPMCVEYTLKQFRRAFFFAHPA